MTLHWIQSSLVGVDPRAREGGPSGLTRQPCLRSRQLQQLLSVATGTHCGRERKMQNYVQNYGLVYEGNAIRAKRKPSKNAGGGVGTQTHGLTCPGKFGNCSS